MADVWPIQFAPIEFLAEYPYGFGARVGLSPFPSLTNCGSSFAAVTGGRYASLSGTTTTAYGVDGVLSMGFGDIFRLSGARYLSGRRKSIGVKVSVGFLIVHLNLGMDIRTAGEGAPIRLIVGFAVGLPITTY